MAQKKGAFVIKNAEGVVTLAGIATSLTNDVRRITHSDATEINEHRDAGNVPRTFTKDFNCFEMSLELIPGIGGAHADEAAVKALFASVEKFDTIVTSGFEDPDFNWDAAAKAIIFSIDKTLAQGELMSINITARKYTTTGGVVIDFTAAWASI
jgi:hypothetical protein